MNDHPELHRGLKNRHINLIALGGIIGSSYFLGTGYVLNQVGPSAFLAYILGGLIMFLTMACLAELSTADPMQGSFISYSTKYISASWACGVGWSYWISWVVYIPSECVAAGIIMHHFAPGIPIYLWAILFGIVITLINSLHVAVFGEMEFWLALIKLFLLISFSLLAVAIIFGYIPKGSTHGVGTEYLLQEGGLFPNGYLVLFLNMVILLANFQGSEIIGLSAAESDEPLKSIPRALKTTSYRIIGLYLIPTFLLAVIFPWKSANLSGSVFSHALAKYGLIPYAHFFSFMIIAGALSCANSGLYAAVRALYGLAIHDMGPKFLKRLSVHGVPTYCALFTVGAVWFLLLGSSLFPSSSLYANLLALSGFTGSTCWISICWAQFRFRRGLHSTKTLPYKVRWFPYLTLFAIGIQLLCLLVVIANPHLRLSFYLGLPATLVPIMLYKFFSWRRAH